MKRFIALVLLAATASAGAQQGDSTFDDRWYAGLAGGFAWPGNDRRTDGQAPYYGIHFGRFYSPDLSLDLRLDRYRADFETGSFGDPFFEQARREDIELTGLGLVARYHLGQPDDRHRFFGLAGIGIQEHDSIFDEGRDFYASLGLGIRSSIGENVSFRTQLEGRFDNDRRTFDRDNGFFDVIASVGLAFAFGEPPRAPAPQRETDPVQRAPEPAPAPEPPPEPEPTPEPQVLFEFDATVMFAFDSATLRPEAEAELDRAADVLAPRDDLAMIEVAGHTDDIGSDAYNQALSERRAQAVADYLVDNGVDRDLMEVVGYGESRPMVPNDSPENRRKNRRVVISTIEE